MAVQRGNPVNVTWGFNAPRWLSVAQISVDGLGCVSDTVMLQVQSLPALNVTGDPEKCVGTVGTYTSPLFPNLDYQWSIVPANAGTIKSGQDKNTVEVFWQEPGNHVVKLTRCSQTANFPVTVHANPDPMPLYPEGVCPGDFNTATAGAIYSDYTWKNEAGSIISDQPIAQVTHGTYSLAVTAAYG